LPETCRPQKLQASLLRRAVTEYVPSISPKNDRMGLGFRPLVTDIGGWGDKGVPGDKGYRVIKGVFVMVSNLRSYQQDYYKN